MSDENTYPLSSVLVALELSEDTVTNWSRRGMHGLVIEPSGRGRGRSRRLGGGTVNKLALMKAMVGASIPVRAAATWADWALFAMQSRPPIQTMTIYTYPGEYSLIAFNGEPLKAQELVPPWVSHTLYVANVLSLTKQALGMPAETDPSEPSPKPSRSRRVALPKA